MSTETTSSSAGGIDLRVGLTGHKTIDYDRKLMRKALNTGGGEVRSAARRLVSRRAISGAGENPGLVTGRLRRSIKIYKRGSKGGWVKVGPTVVPGMDLFYPAILYYGSTVNNIQKRNNYMADALQEKADSIRGHVRGALRDSLKPRY